MSAGRTSWWPKDAAWHRRELIVELGEEYGAEGPLVVDVLACETVRRCAGSTLTTGFGAVARNAHTSPERARAIIECAVELGVLDRYRIQPSGMFSVRYPDVSSAVRRWRHTARQRARTLSPSLRARISYYGDLCWVCRTAPWEQIDHVKPLARGGSNLLVNLRPICATCNQRKGARWPFGGLT